MNKSEEVNKEKPHTRTEIFIISTISLASIIIGLFFVPLPAPKVTAFPYTHRYSVPFFKFFETTDSSRPEGSELLWKNRNWECYRTKNMFGGYTTTTRETREGYYERIRKHEHLPIIDHGNGRGSYVIPSKPNE